VLLRVHDRNCRQIKNCGSTPGFPCAPKARVVDVSAAMPAPVFDQPSLGNPGGADHAGQWWLLDVVGVVPQ
jgi:hypothetical protein